MKARGEKIHTLVDAVLAERTEAISPYCALLCPYCALLCPIVSK